MAGAARGPGESTVARQPSSCASDLSARRNVRVAARSSVAVGSSSTSSDARSAWRRGLRPG